MSIRLQGKKIAAIGVTAKYAVCVEPLLQLLEKHGAEVSRVVCGASCPYELHKVGYKKITPESFASFDAVISIEFWGNEAVPKHVPLISVAHCFDVPVAKHFLLTNPHYLQHCDYYFTNVALCKKDIPPNFFVFSSRRNDHVCLIPVSLIVFGQMLQTYHQNVNKDCIFFVMCAMGVRGQIDQRAYDYIDYILNNTGYICAFRPAPGDLKHPQISALIEHFHARERFVVDSNSSTNVYMQRACYCIGYKTTLSIIFSFISGKPNIELDFSDTIADDAPLRRDPTGTGYLAANVHELKRIIDTIEHSPLHMKNDITQNLSSFDFTINTNYEEEYVQCVECILNKSDPIGSIRLPISQKPLLSLTTHAEELMFFSRSLNNKTMGTYAPVLDGQYSCWDMARMVWHHAASTGHDLLTYGFSLLAPNYMFPIKNSSLLLQKSFVLISQNDIPLSAKEYVQINSQYCMGWWRQESKAHDSLLPYINFTQLLQQQPTYIVICGNTLEEIEQCIAEFYKCLSMTLIELEKIQAHTSESDLTQ